jgi:hypothetical protein
MQANGIRRLPESLTPIPDSTAPHDGSANYMMQPLSHLSDTGTASVVMRKTVMTSNKQKTYVNNLAAVHMIDASQPPTG